MNKISDRDFITLCLCAFRYALNRNTGIDHDISLIIDQNKENIESWAMKQMDRDTSYRIEKKSIHDSFGLEGSSYCQDNL